MTKHTNISLPAEIVIGKDVLELVSSAMYVDPLTIYREYIQNAADSIDVARSRGLLRADQPGRVDITLDIASRTVTIRDNGAGVPKGEFAQRLTALGGSRKRGSSARGFRGIGRLAGLGYCQQLVFRSRADGEAAVQELRWDCKVFKRLLSDHTYQGSVEDLIREVAAVRELPADGYPPHFYEVELQSPRRIRNDILLNPEEIHLYLSQVGPVPFSPDFRFRDEIRGYLTEHLDLT